MPEGKQGGAAAERALELHELVLRLAALLRSLTRELGLEPVQLQALAYLARCNRYSDTPAAVSDYLAASRGSVSRTLGTLVSRGLLARVSDASDGRVVHLSPTASGHRLLARALPPDALSDATSELGSGHTGSLISDLRALLRGLQTANGGIAFGVCHSCSQFRREAGGRFRCGLTLEPLSQRDGELLCREHSAPTSELAS